MKAMIMDDRTLMLFQRRAIKSKAELLQSIDAYLQYLDTEDELYLDGEFYKPALIKSLQNFKDELARCDLAYLNEPFEAYEVVITNTGIHLESAEYTKICFDENDEPESSEASVYPPILEIEAPFISLEEFAERCSVDIATALDWIETRKIKCAKKEASIWYVSAFQGIPLDEAWCGRYTFVGEKGDLGSIASLLKGAMYLDIFPQDKPKDTFDVVMSGADERIIKHEQMRGDSLRAIEDLLICSPDVMFYDAFITSINEKKILSYDRNPFLEISQEQIARFVERLELPSETKKILRAMARSNCGENLFVSTLGKLSLKERFLEFIKETA